MQQNHVLRFQVTPDRGLYSGMTTESMICKQEFKGAYQAPPVFLRVSHGDAFLLHFAAGSCPNVLKSQLSCPSGFPGATVLDLPSTSAESRNRKICVTTPESLMRDGMSPFETSSRYFTKSYFSDRIPETMPRLNWYKVTDIGSQAPSILRGPDRTIHTVPRSGRRISFI